MPPQIEKTGTLDEHDNIQQTLPVDNNQNIFNIQKYLLILLFIQWFVFFITFGVGIYSVLGGNGVDISSGLKSLIPIIGLVICYTFGLLVTYKQHRIGLFIFASIGIVLFIAICILMGYLILAITALSIGFGNTGQVNEFVVFMWIFFIVVVIVAIMSLKFSFDLAKSIKRNEYSSV